MASQNPKPLNVVIIAEYDSTTDWVQNSLREQNYNLIGVADSVYRAIQWIEQNPVDIVLADSSGEGVTNTDWLQTLTVELPELMVIVTAAGSEMDFVQRAMLAGAKGFLLKPFDLTELYNSIEQVRQLWLQRDALLTEAAVTSDGADTPTKKAHSIAVFSPKGGSGATTIAVNLAIAIKKQTDAPVLIVDADLRTSDLDIFLNVLSQNTIMDLLELDHQLDYEILESVMTKHASGIMVLRGDPNLQFIDSPIDPGVMLGFIEEIILAWDGYLIINTTSGLNRWTVEILDVIDTALIVTTPELPALRATRNFLDIADAKAETNGKWHLIMSAYQGKKMLRTEDIEASTHFPITATISEDINLVSNSINRGLPLLLSHQKSAIAKDVIALASQLTSNVSHSSKPHTAGDTQDSSSRKQKSGQEASPRKKVRFWQSLAGTAQR